MLSAARKILRQRNVRMAGIPRSHFCSHTCPVCRCVSFPNRSRGSRSADPHRWRHDDAPARSSAARPSSTDYPTPAKLTSLPAPIFKSQHSNTSPGTTSLPPTNDTSTPSTHEYDQQVLPTTHTTHNSTTTNTRTETDLNETNRTVVRRDTVRQIQQVFLQLTNNTQLPQTNNPQTTTTPLAPPINLQLFSLQL